MRRGRLTIGPDRYPSAYLCEFSLCAVIAKQIDTGDPSGK